MNPDMTLRTAPGLQDIEAVGFDLGETLLLYPGVGLSWKEHYPKALGAVAEACAFALSDDKVAGGSAILSSFNTRENPREEEVSATSIFQMILETWGLDPALHLDHAVDAFFTYFQRNAQAYDDSEQVICALQTRGIKVGILTDVPYGMPKSFVMKDLESAGISRLSPVVVTSQEAGFRKPHIGPYVTLAQKLDVSPTKMVYIGNEKKDIEGALAAGMRAALVNRSERELNFGQDISLPDLGAFVNLLG